VRCSIELFSGGSIKVVSADSSYELVDSEWKEELIRRARMLDFALGGLGVPIGKPVPRSVVSSAVRLLKGLWRLMNTGSLMHDEALGRLRLWEQ
jgi:hypothetical protein